MAVTCQSGADLSHLSTIKGQDSNLHFMFLHTPGNNKLLKRIMVANISQSIKVKVLKEWLQGFIRNKIAKDNGIGAGTVTKIHQQSRNNGIADIESMRKIAIMLKEEGIDLNYFASSVN